MDITREQMMHVFHRVRLARPALWRQGLALQLILGMTVLLAGCGTNRSIDEANRLFAEGNNDEALAKLEDAVKQEPKNAELRITLINRKTSFLNRTLLFAEVATREGRLTDAEKLYKQVLRYDTSNAVALQGLDALVQERLHRVTIAEADALFKKADKFSVEEASEKVRTVLSRNPQQKDALELKNRIDELRAKEGRPGAQLGAAYKKPITLEFRDAPLRSIFDMISKVSGLNFFFDRDLRPDLKATVFAKNTTIEDAVKLLLITNQLEQKVLNENTVLIYPNTPQKTKDYQTLAVRTFYLTNADVKAVSATIKSIVKTKDMVIDERLGLIILRDTPDAIRMAERIVKLQDLGDPEVMLEVEVVEIKRSRLLELGIQWPAQLGLAPLKLGGGALTLSDLNGLNSSTTQATIGSTLINARKELQDGNILANPRIRVRNKEKAKILIGDRVPVITTTSNATGFVAESVTYVDVGLKLEVEPAIYLDQEVAIKINLEVSNLVREVLSKSGSLSYQIGTRNATTVLRLKDGETQVLAGLISDEERTTANKVPGLGEIPIAGRLFGSQKDDTQRSEILLSITPRILRSIRRPDLLEAEFESGTESDIGGQSMRLSSVPTAASSGGVGVSPGIAGVTGSTSSTNSLVTLPDNVGRNGGATASESRTVDVPQAPSGTVKSVTPIASSAIKMSWQMPVQVKAGEQFAASLRVSSELALRGLPLLVGFDPQLLQVVSVQEGDFFKQAGGQTSFNQRVDPAQGKVFVAALRKLNGAGDLGINGAGAVVNVVFKALKPTAGTKVQLLSVSPEPAPAAPLLVPLDQALKIIP